MCLLSALSFVLDSSSESNVSDIFEELNEGLKSNKIHGSVVT